MIEKYFKDFDRNMLKRTKAAAAAPLKKGDKKSGARAEIDIRMLKDALARIIPSQLAIDAAHPVDSAGFSPEGVDLVVYKRYCSDILKLMDGYIPCELICGLFHVIQNLNKDSLPDFLNTIATAKKINNFVIGPEETQKGIIPSFGIVANMNYQFYELKNDIINHYLSKNLEYQYEIDILVIFRKGLIVKNWREKRSFIALETNEDTNMWFYILMNEYLDLNNEAPIDFRKYVKKEIIYNEY